MKIRLDAVLISSVLFTISLLALVPHNLKYASTWRQAYTEETDRLFAQNFFMPMGFAALAIVLVGLIVIWMGYIKRTRWTWFVMFVIVWVYVFPVFALPTFLLAHAMESFSWSGWVWEAVKSPGADREFAKGPAEFLVMLIALFLPVRSFFRRPSAP
jgi:small-conductance mechanosensitive channel